MSIAAFRGRCHHCGHDHDADNAMFQRMLQSSAPSETATQIAPADLKALEHDALRYRWLRSEQANTYRLYYPFWHEFEAKLCREEKMDALIDDAMTWKEPEIDYP